MVLFDIVALLVVASVLITVFMAVGRPVAELLADKSRYKFKGLDSEAEEKLVRRLDALEEEVRQTRKQLAEVKESSEFGLKMIESKIDVKRIEKSPGCSPRIKTA